jgi:hypothetical protein
MAPVGASSRAAQRAFIETAMRLGDVTGLIHAAGVSPTQASPATIVKVDLYGTGLPKNRRSCFRVIYSCKPSHTPGKNPSAPLLWPVSGTLQPVFVRERIDARRAVIT